MGSPLGLSKAALALSFQTVIFLSLPSSVYARPSPGWPMVINTWGGPFVNATDAAYEALLRRDVSALDAVEIGCTVCEENQCDGSVGFGGSPDENCETTLDAMIMDGVTMKSGAVAGLRRIKNAIGVARAVLEYTSHTLLAGDLATQFAIDNGFQEENLTTDATLARCATWREGNNCQPNYRQNVSPDASAGCGPYTPLALDSSSPDYFGLIAPDAAQASHDTISLMAIDAAGIMAAGTSTNGASFKVPGRVGDGPITGSGSYVDGDVGACGATGDGDIMMRFLPCYQAVENLRRGMNPEEAAYDAVLRMVRKYPAVASGIVVVDKDGEHGAAASGWGGTFTYAFRGGLMNATNVVGVPNICVPDSLKTQP
ncbi:asparaginase [Sodiomyces alkalinus F11]|uniref:Asparaginase n=1 Tax=Sodiomyces alkalinus (strain CBS 110278 / VKM F-3762 / F11) TaxID=1314773 RepID=A0A3N2Q4Y4_SODAK|nr:asparaginase [Sodiomyces alkalinus F11]ROT41822.1 asparaginase [Sodiomyces alkalinus F11]